MKVFLVVTGLIIIGLIIDRMSNSASVVTEVEITTSDTAAEFSESEIVTSESGTVTEMPSVSGALSSHEEKTSLLSDAVEKEELVNEPALSEAEEKEYMANETISASAKALFPSISALLAEEQPQGGNEEKRRLLLEEFVQSVDPQIEQIEKNLAKLELSDFPHKDAYRKLGVDKISALNELKEKALEF